MAGDRRLPVFRAERYLIAAAGLVLSAIEADEAPVLGAALAAIDPWARYGSTAENLIALFQPTGDGGVRLAVRPQQHAAPIGAVVIRTPWLAGPYIQFLALMPDAQGAGRGHAILDWYEAEARAAGVRNLWICAAAFNLDAQRLYERCGFERVTVIDDLVKPGFDEILMRKRLNPSGS